MNFQTQLSHSKVVTVYIVFLVIISIIFGWKDFKKGWDKGIKDGERYEIHQPH